MRTLPEQSEQNIQQNDSLASQILEDVVCSMSQYTDDSISPKFLPPEELLIQIRPVAAAFALLHFIPLPPTKEIYKSHLYALFYFSIICGIQMYIKERAIAKHNAPYTLRTNHDLIRDAKNTVMKHLTEGIKVLPPINQTMDIFLSYIITPRRLERLPLKNTEFDTTKFHKFMPVTLLWGYLFAKEIIIDR
jgi:hypothetical protein